MRRSLAAVLTAALLATGLTAGVSWRVRPAVPEIAAPTPVLTALPPAVVSAAAAAAAEGQAAITLELMLAPEASPAQAAQAVERLGGKVAYQSPAMPYLQVQLPPDRAGDLLGQTKVTNMTPDRRVRIRSAQFQQATREAAREGFRLNADLVRAAAFAGETGSLGRFTTIAIVDTGVDPSHPDLQVTPSGRPKIREWYDFTGEGSVDTTLPVTPGATFTPRNADGTPLVNRLGQPLTFNISGIATASGRMWFGLLREEYADLDHNGSTTDAFGVLVVDADPALPGQYNTVVVDTNGNGDFTDEEPLRHYNQTRQVGFLGRNLAGAGDSRLPFVVTLIREGGNGVMLGFDNVGHGTHVAGIAAAWSENGLRGIAPEAQLVVLKALDSSDSGWWSKIAQATEFAARELGAQVINLSLEHLDEGATAFFRRIVQQYKVVVVLAAGNQGPGLSSARAPGDSTLVLTVGGYYSPEIWERDYGYRLPGEGIWVSSSRDGGGSGVGPRLDGALVPTLVAPFSAPSAVPRWKSPSGYGLQGGTSMAAPHVAGAAALLLSAAADNGLAPDVSVVKRALEMGARTLEGWERFEQGFGLLNVQESWQHLQRLPAQLPLSAVGPQGATGLLARNYVPGRAWFTLSNVGATTRVNVVSDREWLLPAQHSQVLLPQNSSRQISVAYLPPARPGVYSGFLEINAGRPGYELKIPNTIVVPHRLTADGTLTISQSNVYAGNHKRDFFLVPAGTQRLRIVFRLGRDSNGRVQGRARAMLFRPDGQPAYRSEVLGLDQSEPRPSSEQVVIERPMPGVWELLGQSEPDLVQHSATPTSAYEVELQAFGMGAATGSDYVAGEELRPDRLRFNYSTGGATVRETVWVTSGMLPFTGGLAASGFGRPEDETVSRVVVEQGRVEEFTLNQPAGPVRIEAQAVLPLRAQVGLRLLRRTDAGVWEVVRRRPPSTDPVIGLEIPSLLPGNYMVYVDSDSNNPQLQYQRTVFYEGLQVRTADPPRRRARGDRWMSTLEIDVPSQPGRYLGHVLLRDTENDRTLAWLPVEVSVGQPALLVRPLDPHLRVGAAGYLQFEVLDAASGKGLDGPVLVDGRRYMAENGRVEMTLVPPAASFTLPVEVDLPGYQPFTGRFSFGARTQPGSVPVTATPEQENSPARQKVQSLLGQ